MGTNFTEGRQQRLSLEATSVCRWRRVIWEVPVPHSWAL